MIVGDSVGSKMDDVGAKVGLLLGILDGFSLGFMLGFTEGLLLRWLDGLWLADGLTD